MNINIDLFWVDTFKNYYNIIVSIYLLSDRSIFVAIWESSTFTDTQCYRLILKFSQHSWESPWLVWHFCTSNRICPFWLILLFINFHYFKCVYSSSDTAIGTHSCGPKLSSPDVLCWLQSQAFCSRETPNPQPLPGVLCWLAPWFQTVLISYQLVTFGAHHLHIHLPNLSLKNPTIW